MHIYMYTDNLGYSIGIVTDKEFLSQTCKEAEPGVTTDKIVGDLINTARRMDGCRERLGCLGLAANQIGESVRIIVLKINNKFKPFINPVIIERAGIQESTETCFSRPGKPPAKVERSIYVKVANQSGKSISLHGLSAIAFQHELDHLNGVLI